MKRFVFVMGNGTEIRGSVYEGNSLTTLTDRDYEILDEEIWRLGLMDKSGRDTYSRYYVENVNC